MDIVLASKNKNKINELKVLFSSYGLSGLNVLSLEDIGVFDDIDEYGKTFEENSLIKASVPAKLGYIGIADDSGLCVDALGGAPGVYSARYSGENATYDLNNTKLLRELSEVPDEKRGARFVCVVSCVFPQSFSVSVPAEVDMTGVYPDITGEFKAFCVRGECLGTILRERRGDNGFGYDPLFYIREKDKSFAELSGEEKNAVSHRGRAMLRFAQLTSGMIGGINADK